MRISVKRGALWWPEDKLLTYSEAQTIANANGYAWAESFAKRYDNKVLELNQKLEVVIVAGTKYAVKSTTVVERDGGQYQTVAITGWAERVVKEGKEEINITDIKAYEANGQDATANLTERERSTAERLLRVAAL